ncbi:MAG: cupin domain-containing protein [Ruminococcaceae bacterium]|nr:cupin domain-containing protein [Oscillospiraceae bacterium]
MIKRSYKDLEPYFPAGHFGVTCKRYHGKDETGAEKFWIGISEFEPGGGADWAYDDNPLEKVYFILEGEMTVTDKDGNKCVMGPMESISFPPNEGRGLKNESDKPAKMLVIINYPEAK